MKLIPLRGKYGEGKFTMVDDWWYEKLNRYRWYATEDGYTERKENGQHIKMHRVVNQTPKGKITAHLNQNGFDNQEHNLRTATHSTNGANKPKPFGKGHYTGVTKVGIKYRSQTMKDCIHYDLGYFSEERWAAMARDIAARDLFGEFAYLNFSGELVGMSLGE